MPTHHEIAGDTETDIGWAFVKVERSPETGERVAAVITCKHCKASTRYDVAFGGIVNAFQHVEPCPVLEEVQRQARAHIERARSAVIKES